MSKHATVRSHAALLYEPYGFVLEHVCQNSYSIHTLAKLEVVAWSRACVVGLDLGSLV